MARKLSVKEPCGSDVRSEWEMPADAELLLRRLRECPDEPWELIITPVAPPERPVSGRG